MKVLNKIKRSMCLNKPPVTKGFRVSLKWDLGVRKGVCCGSLEELRQKICLKFPECGERQLGLYTQDGTEVPQLPAAILIGTSLLKIFCFVRINVLA